VLLRSAIARYPSGTLSRPIMESNTRRAQFFDASLRTGHSRNVSGSLGAHRVGDVGCGERGVGQEAVVGHRGLVAVAPFGESRAGGGIGDHGDLEAQLEEFAQVGLGAEVCQHSIGLRSPNLVRANDDRLPILDVGLEAIEPVGARASEATAV
jgi:hypothetical protein